MRDTVHYRKERGYRRYPGRDGRPVYLVQMTQAEVAGRRALIGVIGTVVFLLGGIVLWTLSMI